MIFSKSINILFILSLCFAGAACSASVSEENSIIDMSDVKIEQSALSAVEGLSSAESEGNKIVSTFGDHPEGTRETLADGSELLTSYDSYGNKVQIRTFADDPNILSVTAITGADGTKTIEVKGRTGKRETLPADWFDKALSVSVTELSSATGLTGFRVNPDTQTSASAPSLQAPVSTVPVPQIYAPTTKAIKQQQAAAPQTSEQPTEEAQPAESKKAEPQPENKNSESPTSTPEL